MKVKLKSFISVILAMLFVISGCNKEETCKHNYQLATVVSNPTCTNKGKALYTCTNCGESFYQVLDALGHAYGELHQKEEATCKHEGHQAYYQCERCENYFDADKVLTSYEKLKISKLDHTYDKKVIDAKYLLEPASCESKAIYYYSCDCGEKGTETFEHGDPLGHNYGTLIKETESTCSNRGLKSHYHCDRCEEYFDENKVKVTYESLLKDPVSHNYQLTQDETEYECANCHDKISSGKEEVQMAERKNYIFIGSSITNGYNALDKENHYSMADMYENDYIQMDYKYHNKTTFVTRSNIYLRKVNEVEQNIDGVGGYYQYYDEKVMLDGNGNGTFSVFDNTTKIFDVSFKYTLKGTYIELEEPTGYLFSFFGHFFKGNQVYKHAQDGNSLSEHEKYNAAGQLINPTTNYCYRLREAVAAHKDEDIDTVIIQLSTNDVGNYIDSRGSAGEHVPFGSVSPDNIRSSDQLNTQTSLGALEWLVAKSIETWGCKVVIYTCHMSDSEYAIYKNNNYDFSKVKTDYAELYQGCLGVVNKWKSGLIDLFASKDVNIALHEDHARCLSDTLHLTPTGYEKVFLQVFRSYCDKEGY